MHKRTRVSMVVAAVTAVLAGLVPLNPAGAAPAPAPTAPATSAVALTCDPGEACIMDNIFNTLYTNAG
ncbi:MAG TPA: hypothetical protein VIL36_01125, partial [Acidimicrobiales bacterium]